MSRRYQFQLPGCAGSIPDTIAGQTVPPRVALVWLLAGFLCCGAFPSMSGWGARIRADEPELESSLSTDEILLGESVDFQVEVRHAQNPGEPDVSPLKQQFDVVSLGNQSRNQSSTFIINGRVSQQNILSHVYLYRLTPRIAGNLEIPPVQAMADGMPVTGQPLRLRVLAAEVQDVVIPEIRVSSPTVYPTQPFDVTLRVLVRPLPDDDRSSPLSPLRRQPPHLQINWVETPDGLTSDEKSTWLQPLLSGNGVGFTLNDVTTRSGSIFMSPQLAVFELQERREQRAALNGESVNYFVYELTRTFTAGRTGSFEFGSAVVKGTFVSGDDGQEYAARRLVAIAPAVTVTVREVPSPRPPTWCGGIGDYQIAASAGPTTLRVGDPLTLTLVVERGARSGSLDMVSPPSLSSIPGLQDRFDIIDDQPTGRTQGHAKKFSYALRPKLPGVSLPPLTITTFDPESETFVDTVTPEIPLEVTEAAAVSASELVGQAMAADSPEIRSSTEGIFQNISSLQEVYDQRVSLMSCVAVSAVAWIIAAIGVAVIRVRRRRSGDPVWLRRAQAQRTAQQRVAQAGSAADAGRQAESLQLLRLAACGLIADLCDKVTEGLTAVEVTRILHEAEVSEEDRARMRGLLDFVESAQYGAAASSDISGFIQSAGPLLERVGMQLERNRRSTNTFRKSVAATVVRTLLAVCLVTPSLAMASDNDSRQAAFLKGLELFDKAQSPDDYRAAARQFQSILSDGFRNGAVYYNLGNAWYRAGEYGRAILSYRRALPWRPNDPYLQANLQQALQRAPGRLSPVPPPVHTRILFWSSWYSFPTRLLIGCAAMVLSALFVLLAVALQQRRLYWISGAGLLIAVLFAIDIGLNYGAVMHPATGVVTTETTARKGTGRDYEPAFDQPLRDGAEFEILAETSDWTFGRFEGIGDGWLKNEHIAR